MVSFGVDGLWLHSKVVEGNYPNWRNVIPRDAKAQPVINRQALLDAVRYCATLGPDGRYTNVKLVSEDKGHVTVSRLDAKESEARRTITAKNWPKFAIAFDAPRLLDLLRTFEGEDITLDLIDEMSPLTIRQEQRTAVVMPMRVQ
jgi:DNA polymerase III subunit beta